MSDAPSDPPDGSEPDDFGAGSIRVMHWPEPAQMRPSMYVGDARDGSGLHYMMEFAVRDALARRPTHVIVGLEDAGMIVVTDDGDILTSVRPSLGRPVHLPVAEEFSQFAAAVETALTEPVTYGTGNLPIVNALSSRLRLRLWWDGEEYRMDFEDGRTVTPLAQVGRAPLVAGVPRRGNQIAYLASTEIFGRLAYDRALIARLLRDLATSADGVRLTLD